MVTNEAFTLIVLENSWNKWVSKQANEDTNLTREGDVDLKKEGKYTSKGRGKDATKYGGWNREGRTRFKM